jgi:uncharacterized protein with HEPN domain
LAERTAQQRARDVYHATCRIEQKIRHYNLSALRHDQDAIDVISYQILIIGEAVDHLPEALKESDPELDWAGMKAMRNVMAHHYWQIEVETLWRTATVEVPVLRQRLEWFLEEFDNTTG